MISIDQAFPKPLKGEFVGKGQWKLTDLFEYKNLSDWVIVPAGFISDGFSIPKIVTSLIGSPWGKGAKSAIIHDFGYHVQQTTRKEADRMFLEGMKILGVSWWRRGTMYNCVRLVAWIPWNRRAKEFNLIKTPI